MIRKEVIIGDCRLILGDSLEVLPLLDDVSAILTDPPYGIGFAHGGNDNSGIGKGRYATKFAKVAIESDDRAFDPAPWLALGVPSILWGGNHYASRLPASQAWLIWDKRAASGHSNDFADCEIAWTNLDHPARMFRHHWDGMMKASERGIARHHPTQKPVALMKWCLGFLPNARSILDPYMGSGSTGVACAMTGRSFIGIELDEGYFNIACERIRRAYGQLDLFIDYRAPRAPQAVQQAFLLEAAE